MNETIETEPTPEELELQRQAELAARYMAELSEPEIPSEKRRECGPEITELEAMMAAFEETHSLEALHAIVDQSEFVPVVINEATGVTVLRHPVREPARLALEPITDKLDVLIHETNITKARHEELKARSRRLSQAVGMVTKGKVIHDR
jgi:hypothetical protein